MTTVPKVTREVLESYLHCKSKGHLKLAREHGTKSDYEVWHLDLTARQQSGAVANLTMRYRGYKVGTDVALTVPNMESGPEVILRGKFENDLFSLSLDALVKTEPSATQGQSHYIPVLFHDDEIRAPQKTLLELFALIISELQETEPTVGLVCRSKGKPTTIRLTPGLQIARSFLREIKELHQGLSTPMLVLNNHCQVCEFHDRCRAQALKEDNLSLLRGMNELQITRLNKKGIFTVNQLSYTFKTRRRPKRARKSSPVHHFPLRALALREKKILVHGNPDLALAGTRIYLDIEGTPQSHLYYLIGVITISGEHESHDTYWADTASGSDQIRIFVRLLDHLNQYSEYRLLHFGSYETVALRRMQTHMAERHKRQIENALKRSINILSVISPHIYLPTYSNSLKEIGGFLGYQWSDPSSSGIQTLAWRDRWLSDREPSLKAKLIRYNYEDCVALKGVVEFLEQILAAGPSGSSRDRQGTEIVPTSALAVEKDGGSLYGPTGFVLDDFRTINKLSYFDYQRERVFARTGRHRKKAMVKTNRKPPAPNKIVTLRAARCPICRSRELKALSQTAHEVADLRFMPAGGVKRWKTRYVTWRYCCTQCGSRFVPAAFRRHRKLPRYGRGLISWCIYQLLIGGQNINRVHRSLLDLFGLPIPKTSVYLFKRAVAEYFKLGYENTLKDLLSGDLINIDETTVNLQKDKGYVWVLASTNSVYFFYRKSREGSFLADTLQEFKGVLVSDFYTAYDSLDMPQQRCLIHLMRDINDDLLKHPFDDELKSIASRFSCLLKAIVDTIDRYGLRKRHLNKHRAHAERFCDWAVARDFGSEAAKNYVRRIAKYRIHLFAFLACDGIPWNNNNAEHAIKSFAKFRRFSNGTVTEDTVKDYLVILSVCLTCEYRGIEFLKVLRGETKGDFGFGPKRFTPLRLRPPRPEQTCLPAQKEVAEPQPGLGAIPAEGTQLDEGYGKSKVITLNKLLPKICDRLGSAFGSFRCRAELAADLWPVQVDPTELEFMMTTIADYIRKVTRQRTIIFNARNIRFYKPEPGIGLTGGYVAVSLSDRGRIKQLRPPARGAVIPAGLGTNVSLDQVWIRAKGFGGTATVRSVQTGRNAVATIVTAYIPQYSARSNDGFNLRAAGLLAAQ